MCWMKIKFFTLKNLIQNVLGLGHLHKMCSIVSDLAPFKVSYSLRHLYLFVYRLFNSVKTKIKKEKHLKEL